jgi:hemoglobin-like flavoprotein
MNESSIARIRDSFDAFAPRLDSVVGLFYERLFERLPSVRAIFPADMTRQRGHLAAALAVVARNADRLDMLEAPLMALGAQHLDFGTRPEQYPAMRDALVDSIGVGLGEAWTPQLQADWTAALNTVITFMLKGHARAVLDVANGLTGESARPPHAPSRN